MVYDAVIVGGGISGLTLGYLLQEAGLHIAIIESSNEIGGVCKTITKDGFLLENGPNSTVLKPTLAKLIADIGLQDQLLFPEPVAKRRYIGSFRRGKLSLLEVPNSLQKAIRNSLLSFPGKLRALCEPFISRSKTEDESVSSFISRRFGKEVSRNIVSAILSGIWACDITTLSTRSALPKLWQLEKDHGSVLRGILKGYKNKARERLLMVSFKEGMSALPKRLGARLHSHSLFLSRRICSFVRENDFVTIEVLDEKNAVSYITTRQLIITTPGAESAKLLAAHDPALATQIRKIPFAPLGILHLAFQTSTVKHPLNAFGFLLPGKPGQALLGAICSSSVFKHRAPNGYHLLTCFSGGATNKELANVTAENVKKQLTSEVMNLIGTTSPPTILSEVHHPHSVPNYPVGHYLLQDAVKAFHEKHSNIHILSNWHEGLGISDRVERASMLAENLIANWKLQTYFEKIQDAYNG